VLSFEPFQGFFQGIALADPVDDHIHFTDLQHLDMGGFWHSESVEARHNPSRLSSDSVRLRLQQ